ncbi:NAD(P)H-hydrate dehydratase [Lichenicoccus roseus]|uniref:Bifunctional NAD(P)H-hydrate repair enzyme n=1 Tax=Lichenicoccus roseus TaxID=2683649 RepID=A0A5R9J550_9PROT|nr:NAD(P)H-hydrate dehydratase [Lichenicoccus roseus]TLU72750.1 NAD(P)H-hydrate dehydratase [Lichenicoccus roseus]
MSTGPDDLVLYAPEEMAAADRLAATLMPSFTLMRNAGRAVARAALQLGPQRTLVLCGPGGNGGDGYVAATLLAQQGWPVEVAALAEPRPGSDAAQARAGWHGPIRGFDPERAAAADLVIDAVYGAGLSRPVEGLVAETLSRARRVLAVDVPSGIDGATGAVRGMAPVAELTVTFFRAKPGHWLLPGREHLGRLVVADIGMPEQVLRDVAPRCWENRPGLWHLRVLTVHDHKYSRGVVSICGGGNMTGAARLAAGGARGAGAGLVRLAAEHGADLYRTGAPGLIVDEAPLEELLADERRKVWVCGPGLAGDEVEASLPALLRGGRQVIADAGALTGSAGDPGRLRGAAVLTPHAGEFARLFGGPGDDRLGAARCAAAEVGAVVLLKGSDSIIAAPDGRAAINANAPPWLGTAGAGDVLSGVIAALLAGGMAPFEATCAGVWLHGEAANIAGEGLLAEDLLRCLPLAARRARGSALASAGAVS